DRAVVLAGVDLAERDAELAVRRADLLRDLFALVAQQALLRDVVVVQRIGIGLVAVGRAVAEHDDVAALPELRGQRFYVRRLRERRGGEEEQGRREPRCRLEHVVLPGWNARIIRRPR